MRAIPALMVLSLALAVCLAALVSEVGARKNLVCYFGNYASYRPDAGSFDVKDLDPSLCTHLMYAFTGLSDDGTITINDAYYDLETNYGRGSMKKFTNLKEKNPSLKTLVAIGGASEPPSKFSRMASSQTSRARFIDSVVSFLAQYNFDGLDLDWEYPAASGDKQNFVSLTRELSDAFRSRGYQLTAAVAADKEDIDRGYDIPEISKYLDLINLMTYDYHGSFEKVVKTGLNAPLYSSPTYDESPYEAMLNVNFSVNYWLAQGVPREKLMLGFPAYGRTFTLDNARENGLNAPARLPGTKGPYTNMTGYLGYNEICGYFKNDSSWKITRDPDYQAPYAVRASDRQWIGYDDPESLVMKAQLANQLNLGGMMMWSIDTDDFRGFCSGEKYPLLKAVMRTLDSGAGPLSGTTAAQPATSTTTSQPPATDAPTTTTGAPPATEAPTTTTAQPVATDPPTTTTSQPVTTSTTTTTTTAAPPTTAAPTTTTQTPAPTTTSTAAPTTTTARPTSSQTSAPTTTTTAATQKTTQPQQAGSVCRQSGYFVDIQDCRKYVFCLKLGNQYVAYKYTCGQGKGFNQLLQICDFIANVLACKGQNLSLSLGVSM